MATLIRLSLPLFLLAPSLMVSLSPAAAAEQQARTFRAVRTDSPPEIDGALDDSVWREASWQGGFTQLKPSPGEPARAETRVAVACDNGHLYVAFRCFNPTGLRANSKIARRDGNMDQDNAVTLYLDTFHTRRDCYYFSTNSLGTQVDGRIGEDGGTNDKKWDCPWRVASREDSLGWSAEMAIPVSQMRVPGSEGAVWGINFRRNYPEFFETSFWQPRDVAWRVSQSGELTGLPRFSRRFSASLYPYLVGLDSDSPGANRRTILSSGGRELVVGADLKLSAGNTAYANLTYNPDFATVEADLEVINLTRYETFFPEKRLFFLEGAELFSTPINVFYSRRIGDIDWGAKANGRAGEFNWAALSADERTAGGDPAARTTAVRLQRDILGTSNIGLLAVDRSFDGGFNRVLSTDGVFHLNPRMNISGQLVGSFPSGGGPFKKAVNLHLSRNTQLHNQSLGYRSLEPGFRDNVNRVGFVRDDDRHQVQATEGGEFWIRRYGVEKLSYNQHNNLLWSHGGALRMVDIGGWIGVTFLDRWLLGYARNYVTELFEKRFRNHTQLAEGGYNQQSWNNAGFLYVWGRSFDRDMSRLRLRTNLKPRPDISLSLAYTRLHLSPDPGGQATDLYNINVDYNLTPDLWFRLVGLHNTANDRSYVYGLFGWRFRPPFGALYVAYTRDRYEVAGEHALLTELSDEGTFFVKLTVPLDIY